MKISELTNAPEWLLDAITRNADVDIIDDNVVWHKGVWLDGIWQNGIWENGTWRNGIWQNGKWFNGTWKNGTWKNGIWYSGFWLDGVWLSGTWKNGVWKNGVWEDGKWDKGTWISGVKRYWNNSKWPFYYSKKHIEIGCKTKTVIEWDEWFASSEEYLTPRNTPAFELIYQGYLKVKELQQLLIKNN